MALESPGQVKPTDSELNELNLMGFELEELNLMNLKCFKHCWLAY